MWTSAYAGPNEWCFHSLSSNDDFLSSEDFPDFFAGDAGIPLSDSGDA